MTSRNVTLNNSKVLILGFSFKEDCPDFRNTKIIDIYNELISFGVKVDIYDPLVDKTEVKNSYELALIDNIYINKYDAIILAVKHNIFLNIDFSIFKKNNVILFDTKSFISRDLVDARL
jgi:UDP-N-acetyl-D-galactosamine dehydrogenase